MELLSPAGHWEAMVAAVQNGADAVYLGCGQLNARRGAKNFTPDQLPDAVQYCRLRGVKLYLTLNTLPSDRELPAARDMLLLASRCGVDAVIVQDWGLAALARSLTPDLPLHGSTQMTSHSLAGVERAAAMGLRCVVLGRELSAEDVRHICRSSPIAIEVFAHGALCMCWSGQCAMSALIGSRSGNRGLCAQPCRLPYRFDGGRPGYPLSLKDACLASHLAELEDMGVSILKLEGRMKRPEYVAVITRVYAALLRERRLPTREERRELELAFSREGFTDAYWRGHPGPEMFGVRGESAPDPTDLFRQAKAAYDREDLRTVPVSLTGEITASRPARLTAADPDGHLVSVEGPVPEPARSRALEQEEVKARLSKTGGTVYRAGRVELTLDPGLSLPASAVNALRRDALEGLTACRLAASPRREGSALPLPENVCASAAPALTASLRLPCQLSEALAEAASVIYLPAESIEDFDLDPYLNREVQFCLTLPRICTDREEPALRRLVETAVERGCTALAVQNLGQLDWAEKLGLGLRGDFGLNVFNSLSLQELSRWGLESATVSFELRWEQVRDLRKPLPCEALVYGRLPLMVTENCLISNALGPCAARNLDGLCGRNQTLTDYRSQTSMDRKERTSIDRRNQPLSDCQSQTLPGCRCHTLTDRRGEIFPVLPVFGCRSEVENSKVLYLADKPEYRRCGLAYARLRFTTETAQECQEVLDQYLHGGSTPPASFTRGLFYRGVE